MDIKILTDLVNEGKSCIEIGRIFNVSHQKICEECKKNGLILKKRKRVNVNIDTFFKLTNEDKSIIDIAKILNISRNSVIRKCKQFGLKTFYCKRMKLEKEKLIELSEKRYTKKEIAKELNVRIDAVIYWLRKYKIKSRGRDILYENGTKKKCSTCNEIKDLSLFSPKNSNCRECQCKIAVQAQRKYKLKCVMYKGGKCEICGYNKCLAALDFHHKNPKEKEFNVACYKYCTYANDDLKLEVKRELDKCQLVCSNCHRELEEKVDALYKHIRFNNVFEYTFDI